MFPAYIHLKLSRTCQQQKRKLRATQSLGLQLETRCRIRGVGCGRSHNPVASEGIHSEFTASFDNTETSLYTTANEVRPGWITAAVERKRGRLTAASTVTKAMKTLIRTPDNVMPMPNSDPPGRSRGNCLKKTPSSVDTLASYFHLVNKRKRKKVNGALDAR